MKKNSRRKYVFCYNNGNSLEWMTEQDAMLYKLSADDNCVNMTRKHGFTKRDCDQLKILKQIEGTDWKVNDWIVMRELIK